MATKDELIDEVATLKAKIAELTAGAQVSGAVDSLGMALQAGHVYHLAEMGGLDDLGELEVGKTYVYEADGFEPYANSEAVGGAPEVADRNDADKSPLHAWAEQAGVRVSFVPEDEDERGDAGFILTDMTGTPMALTYGAVAGAADRDAAADRHRIAALEADVAARDVTINELRARIGGGPLHGSIDGLKPVV